MTILLTGATGFLGRHVLPMLEGRDVRILVLPDEPFSMDGAEVVRIDLTEPGDLSLMLSGVQSVIHLAGLVGGGYGDPADFMRVNAQGTTALAQAAHDAGVEQFIYSSSITVYGLVADALEDQPVELTPGYPESKIGAENALRDLLPDQSTILRFPLVIGAGDTGFMLPAVKGFRESGRVVVIGSGQQPWSVISAHDAARALVFALDHPETRGQVYNVTGATITNGALLEAIGEEAGCEKVSRLPTALAMGVAALSELTGNSALTRDQARALSSPLSADSSRFEALGFQPEVAWRDALHAGVQWALEQER
jgi:nucleoside-diphosphate-sugar epimerase